MGLNHLMICTYSADDLRPLMFNISDCDVNANCTNTIGSYKCTCKLGYIGDGRLCLGNFKDDLIDISVYN